MIENENLLNDVVETDEIEVGVLAVQINNHDILDSLSDLTSKNSLKSKKNRKKQTENDKNIEFVRKGPNASNNKSLRNTTVTMPHDSKSSIVNSLIELNVENVVIIQTMKLELDYDKILENINRINNDRSTIIDSKNIVGINIVEKATVLVEKIKFYVTAQLICAINLIQQCLFNHVQRIPTVSTLILRNIFSMLRMINAVDHHNVELLATITKNFTLQFFQSIKSSLEISFQTLSCIEDVPKQEYNHSNSNQFDKINLNNRKVIVSQIMSIINYLYVLLESGDLSLSKHGASNDIDKLFFIDHPTSILKWICEDALVFIDHLLSSNNNDLSENKLTLKFEIASVCTVFDSLKFGMDRFQMIKTDLHQKVLSLQNSNEKAILLAFENKAFEDVHSLLKQHGYDNKDNLHGQTVINLLFQSVDRQINTEKWYSLLKFIPQNNSDRNVFVTTSDIMQEVFDCDQALTYAKQ